MALDKSKLRTEAKAFRSGLRAMNGIECAEQAATHGMQLLGGMDKATVIALYLPIGDEFDPRFLMHSLNKAGYKTALPCVEQKESPLVFRLWSMGDPLVKGPLGTSHPADDAPLVLPNILIVPLLSYDKDCYRLGWGGGYYDRTLAANTFMKAFGFAYAGQFVDELPREDHDFPMHGIITETGIIMPEK